MLNSKLPTICSYLTELLFGLIGGRQLARDESHSEFAYFLDLLFFQLNNFQINSTYK